MSFEYKTRKFDLVNYSKEKHGEISYRSTKYFPEMKDLTVEEQLERLSITFSRVRDEDYGTHRYEKLLRFSEPIEYRSSQYCIMDVVVDDGLVVGFTITSYSSYIGLLSLHKPLFLYETEDNNGAGYNSSDVYISLMVEQL